MNSPKQSASTLDIASTVLPRAEVIPLPVAKRSRTGGAFTKTTVAKMHCPRNKQEALFWDASCRGFGLRALASGRRTWVYQYRDEHKRTRRIALGDASAVSLDAARQSARQHAARVIQGSNPSAERKSKRDAVTVGVLVKKYLQYAEAQQRPRSFAETQRHLQKHARPLHHHKAEVVSRADIALLLERVSNDSGQIAANRSRAALSALWSWGMRSGLIASDSNPVTYTLRHKENARRRDLQDHELQAIWAATAGDGDYFRIVRLCLLTGCRRDEIGGLLREEVLRDRLSIGGSRMKNGKVHDVPLLPAIEASLPLKVKIASGPIFGRRDTGFSGWSKSKEMLDAKLEQAGMSLPRWTLHDFRRAFSTRLHDAGIPPLVIEALLAHKQQGVAAVYNLATFWQSKFDALKRWHELLAEIVGQDELRPQARAE